MELVEGQTLDRMIAPGGMPLAKIFDIAIPLAEALAAAHDKGIVHRDLKPANVMVTKEGRVKVLDFGLAKLTAAAPGGSSPDDVTMSAPLTGRGVVMGTVPYMSPEQLNGVFSTETSSTASADQSSMMPMPTPPTAGMPMADVG